MIKVTTETISAEGVTTISGYRVKEHAKLGTRVRSEITSLNYKVDSVPHTENTFKLSFFYEHHVSLGT